jgi:error-prone DNA polymerase
MGFYAPAQLVRDAREHGVTVCEIDVNFSDWDNGLEGEAVRLGLRQISGFSEADAAKIVAARAAGGRFASVEDVRRRARLSPAALERLAHADAFRSLGADRRRALWEAKALRGEDAPLFQALSDFGPEVDPALPEMPLCEHVAHDYARLKLSLKAHPMAFLRAGLAGPRARRAADLADVASGAWISLSGLVLVRQRPGSAKGVIFMTLEDETGAANVIVWPAAFARHRRIVLTGRLLEVQGRLQKQGKVIHLIAERLIDHTGLLARLTDGDVDFGEAGMARADEVRSGITTEARALSEVRRAALSPRAQKILPNSRDFH